MSIHLGSIDFQKLQGVRRLNDNGEEGVFIPFAQNPCIYAGSKGIYLNIRIKPNVNQTYGQTHMVVADLGKDIRGKLTKEQQFAATPILGGLKTYENFYSNAPYQDGNQPRQRQAYNPYPNGGQPQAPRPQATPVAATPAPAAVPSGMPQDLPF